MEYKKYFVRRFKYIFGILCWGFEIRLLIPPSGLSFSICVFIFDLIFHLDFMFGLNRGFVAEISFYLLQYWLTACQIALFCLKIDSKWLWQGHSLLDRHWYYRWGDVHWTFVEQQNNLAELSPLEHGKHAFHQNPWLNPVGTLFKFLF